MLAHLVEFWVDFANSSREKLSINIYKAAQLEEQIRHGVLLMVSQWMRIFIDKLGKFELSNISNKVVQLN